MALSCFFSSSLSLLDHYALLCSQSVVTLAESCLTAVCQELGWSSQGEFRGEVELGEGEGWQGEAQEEDEEELQVLAGDEEVSLNKVAWLMIGVLKERARRQ